MTDTASALVAEVEEEDQFVAWAKRARAAEKIALQLAERDPIWEENGTVGCEFCSNEFNDRAHGLRGGHATWCLWRRAVEWVDVSDRVVGEVSTKPGRPDV